MDLQRSVSTMSTAKFKNKAKRRRSKNSKRNLTKEESMEVFDVMGVVRIELSHEVQVFIGCQAFRDISFEQPWIRVKKEKFLDHIDLYGYVSPFYPLKQDIFEYPEDYMLMGFLFNPTKFGHWFRLVHDIKTYYLIEGIIKEEEDLISEQISKEVLRPIGEWTSLGSETEVEENILRNSRPLYEVDIKSGFPKNNRYRFKMRMVEDARDGYVELLPDPRWEVENVVRSRVDSFTQTENGRQDVAVQTNYKRPVTKAIQYEYKYEEVEVVDTKFTRGRAAEFKRLVEEAANVVEECLVINNHFGMYEDDYKKLCRGQKSQVRYKEFTLLASLTSNIAVKKLVTNVAWNYFESSLVAVSYTSTPVNYFTHYEGLEDEVHKVMFEKTPVHLWSYNNEIEPVLYLEAKSDVTYLSFCPYVKDILIGGGMNGQVFIWDLRHRVSDVEKIEVLSSHQKLNVMRLSRLMSWCILNVDKKQVDPVYVSPLRHSHTAAVVHVKWMNNTKGISPNGKSYKGKDILQFMTFSIDGSIIVWDLNRFVEDYKSVLSVNYLKRKQRQNKLKHLKRSSFVPLGKTLAPNYKLLVQKDHNLLPILTVLKGVNPVSYKPIGRYDENPVVRTKFKVKQTNEDYKLPVIVATGIGEIFGIHWFGYDYHETTNLLIETCQLKSYQLIHDGPIVTCCINSQINNVILTVGGKVFAIWFIEEPRPLYWRKASLKIIYNEGSWFTKTGSLFSLIRSDGYIDIWNLLVSTERPIHTICLVGTKSINFFGGVTQTEVRKNTIIVSDNYGTMSVYIIPDYFLKIDNLDEDKLRRLFYGQYDKLKKIDSWMEILNNNYLNLEELFQSSKEGTRRMSTRSTNLYAIESFVHLHRERKISQIERMNRIFKNQKWKNVNEQEMFDTIMKKKKINMKELGKYRAPLEAAAEASKQKDIKIERMLLMKDEIFRRAKENIVKEPIKTKGVFVNFSIFQNYSEIEEFVNEYDYIENRVFDFIEENRYEPVLDWQSIVQKAKEKLIRHKNEKKGSLKFKDYLKLKDDFKNIKFVQDYRVQNMSVMFK